MILESARRWMKKSKKIVPGDVTAIFGETDSKVFCGKWQAIGIRAVVAGGYTARPRAPGASDSLRVAAIRWQRRIRCNWCVDPRVGVRGCDGDVTGVISQKAVGDKCRIVGAKG